MGDEAAPGMSGRKGHGHLANHHQQGDPRAGLEERGLIRSQMRLGTGLIAFGALSIPIFQVSGVLEGQAATAAFGIATAVIGAGAAMLPTGAAASASARILRSLPDQDAVTDDQHATVSNGHSNNGQVTTKTAASTGRADSPPVSGN
jgi:hypothetical protein